MRGSRQEYECIGFIDREEKDDRQRQQIKENKSIT